MYESDLGDCLLVMSLFGKLWVEAAGGGGHGGATRRGTNQKYHNQFYTKKIFRREYIGVICLLHTLPVRYEYTQPRPASAVLVVCHLLTVSVRANSIANDSSPHKIKLKI